jgi:Ion channel
MSRSGSRLSVGGWRHRLPVFLLLGVVVLLLAGAGFVALESNVVHTYWEGLWWALSLMTTVGFVGESPETTGGRILSAALMVSGFALLTLTTAAIASLFVREEERSRQNRSALLRLLSPVPKVERFGGLHYSRSGLSSSLPLVGSGGGHRAIRPVPMV